MHKGMKKGLIKKIEIGVLGDENGRNVGSGVYFYQLRAGEYDKRRKMMLVK